MRTNLLILFTVLYVMNTRATMAITYLYKYGARPAGGSIPLPPEEKPRTSQEHAHAHTHVRTCMNTHVDRDISVNLCIRCIQWVWLRKLRIPRLTSGFSLWTGLNSPESVRIKTLATDAKIHVNPP